MVIAPSRSRLWSPTQKPLPGAQIDFTHKLASALVGFWPCSEGAGVAANNAHPNPLPGTLRRGAYWSSSGVAFDGTDDDILIAANPIIYGLTAFTFVISGVMQATGTASFGCYAAIWTGSDNSSKFQILRSGTNAFLQWRIGTGGGSTNVDGTLSVFDGLSHTVAMACDAANVNVYVDGRPDTAVLTPSALQTTSAPLVVGDRDNNLRCKGAVAWFALFNRRLLANEIADIQSYPYQMFLPTGPQRVYSVAAASAPAAGYALWLKADAGAYQNTGLSTPCASDGDPFKGWADQSGNANNATDSTGGLYKTNVLNGKPGLLLNAQFLSGALSQIDSATGITVFYVAKRVAKINEDSIFSLRNTAGVDSNNDGTGVFGYEPTGQDKLDVYAGGSEFAGPSPAPTDGTAYIWCVTLGATNYDGYLNGSTHFGPTALGFAFGGGAGTLYTTARYAGATPSLGPNAYVFEIIVYPSVLSSGDRTTTYNYLNNKYFGAVASQVPYVPFYPQMVAQ